MTNKWSDWEYHALQAMKELSMAEGHLIAVQDGDFIKNILKKVRDIRKQLEDIVYKGNKGTQSDR